MDIKSVIKDYLKQKYPTARISVLTGGHHNINFKVETKDKVFAVRAPKSLTTETVQGLHKETLLLRLVGKQISPELYSSYSVSNIPVIETEFIYGKHENISDLKKTDLRKFGRFIANLHKNRRRRFDPGFSTFGKYKGTHLDYFKQNLRKTVYCYAPVYKNNRLVVNALAKLHDTLEPRYFFRRTFSLTHGDMCKGNIIWTNSKLYLIDWSDGRYADPVDELAYIKAINNLSEEDEQIILDVYTKIIRDTDIHNRFYTYELKNRIFDVGWALSKIAESTSLADKKLYGEFYEVRAHNLERFLVK